MYKCNLFFYIKRERESGWSGKRKILQRIRIFRSGKRKGSFGNFFFGSETIKLFTNVF